MPTVQPAKNRRGQSGSWHTLDEESPSHFVVCRTEHYSGMMHRVREKLSSMLSIWSSHLNENGMVTAVALLLMAVLALLGTSAVVVTSTDILIGGNYKVSEQAFYAAEAGVEEARGRLRGTAEAKISDTGKETDTAWKVYIGTLEMAQEIGFNPSSLSESRVDRLQKDGLQDGINYVVEVKHQVEAGEVKKTAAGNKIYLVTSTGATANSNRTVQIEVTRASPLTVPSPLYVKSETKIMGSSTYISGMDKCGGSDKPAIITTQDLSSIQISGTPTIEGDPENIKTNGPNLDVAAMVNSLKKLANFSYDIVTKTTHTGMNWGSPQLGALEDPSTCSDHNIVHYDTHGTGITLAGGSSGCGILLVEGDLEVHGGFAWHGVVVVTGSLKYTGGGDKQVTGGMLSGGTVDADVEVGGNANIVYCSSAVNNQTINLPLRILSWIDGNYSVQ